MARYQLSPKAVQELEHEIAYSKMHWGAKHAKEYKQALLALVRRINKNPYLFPERPELGEGIRCARFKGNHIIYRLNPKQDGIIVLGFPSIYKS